MDYLPDWVGSYWRRLRFWLHGTVIHAPQALVDDARARLERAQTMRLNNQFEELTRFTARTMSHFDNVTTNDELVSNVVWFRLTQEYEIDRRDDGREIAFLLLILRLYARGFLDEQDTIVTKRLIGDMIEDSSILFTEEEAQNLRAVCHTLPLQPHERTFIDDISLQLTYYDHSFASFRAG